MQLISDVYEFLQQSLANNKQHTQCSPTQWDLGVGRSHLCSRGFIRTPYDEKLYYLYYFYMIKKVFFMHI